MGAIRQSLQAQPQKKIETPNQPIEIIKISNKSIFSISKVKRSQIYSYGGYPTEFPDSSQNP
jgi:hypothetical protein